ncbi:hypothetical protein ACFL3T_02280 [Patescibacteria group bacterium]
MEKQEPKLNGEAISHELHALAEELHTLSEHDHFSELKEKAFSILDRMKSVFNDSDLFDFDRRDGGVEACNNAANQLNLMEADYVNGVVSEKEDKLSPLVEELKQLIKEALDTIDKARQEDDPDENIEDRVREATRTDDYEGLSTDDDAQGLGSKLT